MNNCIISALPFSWELCSLIFRDIISRAGNPLQWNYCILFYLFDVSEDFLFAGKAIRVPRWAMKLSTFVQMADKKRRSVFVVDLILVVRIADDFYQRWRLFYVAKFETRLRISLTNIKWPFVMSTYFVTCERWKFVPLSLFSSAHLTSDSWMKIQTIFFSFSSNFLKWGRRMSLHLNILSTRSYWLNWHFLRTC